MPRRFIALTSLAAGAAIAVTVALATPALAKGATQASITGPPAAPGYRYWRIWSRVWPGAGVMPGTV